MTISNGTPESDGQVVHSVSPGKLLSQGRLQLGLTQEQVAKELYITLAKIKALESDDHGRLNTDTFIRGYIRAYANLVKVDVVEVLAAYDQLLQERSLQSGATQSVTGAAPLAAKTAHTGSPSNVSPPSRGALQLFLVIAAFFLGLWLISIWFFDHQPDKNYTALAPVGSVYSSSGEGASSGFQAETAQSSAAISEEDTAPVQMQSPVVLSSSSVKSAQSSASSVRNRSVSSSSKSVVSASARSSLQAAVPVALAESSAASSLADSDSDKPKSTGLDTISFTFRAECWLEVSDSRGDVLATELQAAGSRLSLVGKAPFDVKLGNAPAVGIQLNNKTIDVIPLLGSNVLTLRVSD